MNAPDSTDTPGEAVDAAESKTDATISKNRRRTGRKRKGPDYRANAATRRVYLTTGVESRWLRDGLLDRRSAVGKVHAARVEELRAHVGGDPTATQRSLIDQAARLKLLGDICFAELVRVGPLLKNGQPSGPLAGYLKAVREERACLLLLGLERRTRPVPDLSEYLAAGGTTPDAAEPVSGAPTWPPQASGEATPGSDGDEN